MTEPTNEELAEALRSIEGLPLGTQLIVRVAADRLCDGDGWIEWEGGNCPVDNDVMVEVEYRDGKDNVLYRTPNRGLAGRYHWYRSGSDSDIFAYRIIGAP